MNIISIQRETTYTLTDEKGNEHTYTISSSCSQNEESPTTYICGVHNHEEIEVPTNELPFMIEALNTFAKDYNILKSDSY